MMFFLVPFSLFSQELPMFYQKCHSCSYSSYENLLVEHAKASFEKSLRLQSKLTDNMFNEVEASKKWRASTIPHYHPLSDLTQIPYYHLLNNLCDFKGASHLHVGLLAGDSFIAALYGNQTMLEQQIGIDWFKECPQAIFYANCNQYLDVNKCQIINDGCFDINKANFKAPIDIYFYDADHSLLGHEKALTYYHDILADVFIVVIDDWNCPWIRAASFKAFSKLNYCVLYENVIPPIGVDNGQYIAVIRKQL